MHGRESFCNSARHHKTSSSHGNWPGLPAVQCLTCGYSPATCNSAVCMGGQARLNALAEETPQADQAGAARGASIFSWRGTAYPVQSERVRTSLAAAAEVCLAGQHGCVLSLLQAATLSTLLVMSRKTHAAIWHESPRITHSVGYFVVYCAILQPKAQCSVSVSSQQVHCGLLASLGLTCSWPSGVDSPQQGKRGGRAAGCSR